MDGNAAYAVYPLGFNCLSASPVPRYADVREKVSSTLGWQTI